MRALARSFDERVAAEIGLLRSGVKADGDYKALSAFFKGREAAILTALIPGLRLHEREGVLEFEVPPCRDFKARDDATGTPVQINYWLKTGRFTSSVHTPWRFGFSDLIRHVLTVQNAADPGALEDRLFAAIGRAAAKAGSTALQTCEGAV
jgi:hypothetical protein